MEHSFFAAIKPFFILSACLGIVPYYFKNKLCTRLNAMYIALLILLYTVLCYEALQHTVRVTRRTALTSRTIQITVCTLQIMVTFLHSVRRREKFMNFAKAMNSCEKNFKKIMNIPYKTIQRQMYVHGASFVLIIVINSLIQHYYVKPVHNSYFLIYVVALGLPIVVNGIVSTLASLHILEIRRGFSVANECLKRMHTANNWRKFEYESVLKQKLWTANVKNLAKIGVLHLELTNCIKEFNDAFGVLLVASCAVTFVSVLMAAYFIYFTYLLSYYLQMFVCGAMAMSYAINITALCQRCHSTTNEVNTCLILI